MFISKALLLDDEENDINVLNDSRNWGDIDRKKVNYVKLGQLLTELGFLPVNLTPDQVERELLFDLWNMLKGEDNNGISVKNIRNVLLVIQGINHERERNVEEMQCKSQEEEDEDAYLNSYGYFKQDGVF